jgi:hypothetical protein
MRAWSVVLSWSVMLFASSSAQASVMFGSAPNPSDADLVMWLRADALALADGAALAGWPDASARGLELRVGGAASPIFRANRLNGLPGVQFDGGAVLSATRAVDLANEHTIVIVAQARSIADDHADTFVSYCDQPRAPAADGCETSFGVQQLHGQRRLRSRYPGADAWEPATPAVLAALSGVAILAQQRVSGNALRSYVMNPTQPVLRADAGAWPSASGRKTLFIGGPPAALSGDVFEVLVYNRALGPLEMQELFDYLTRKWLPNASPLSRVVLSAASSGGGFETFGASATDEAGSLRIMPASAAHSPDVWYRDRGATNFDLLDGALEFVVRASPPSHRGATEPIRLLDLDGGGGGLSLSLTSGGSHALQLELAANQQPIVSVGGAAFAREDSSAYRMAATFSTDRSSGRVTAKLFAAPLDAIIDLASSPFELANATSTGSLDALARGTSSRGSSDPARRATSRDSLPLEHAFAAADGFSLRAPAGRAIDQVRVWSGVPARLSPLPRLPPIADPVRPDPEPALPPDFESFYPPLSAAGPSRGAPRIAEWTRTGSAGDSLALTGADLSAFAGRDEGKDTGFLVFGQSGEALDLTPASILRLQGRRAVIQLDRALPTSTLYWIWPKNAHGYGRPIAVNQTEVWWLGPQRATPGQNVSIYGRNLSHAEGTSDAYVYLKPRGSAPGQWLAPQHVNPYKVDAALPSQLANGEYEIWAHNGHGAHYGWSGPLALTVDDGVLWDGPTFDLHADGGKGATDDAAIQAAIDAASRSGERATVRLSAGTFEVKQTIWLRSHVRLIGAGKAATTLHGSGQLGSHALIFLDHTQTNEIADLTLDFGTALPLQGGDGFVITGDSRRLRMRNVRLQALHDQQLLMYIQLFDATISDCDFVGPQVALLHSAQVAFDRCNFYGTRDSTLLLLANGVRELSVTHCTGQDYDTSATAPPNGWSQGRFINIVNGQRISRDVYLGENATLGLGVNPNFNNQNTGEQICWDEAQGQFIDTPRASDNLTGSDTGMLTFGRPAPPLSEDRSLIAVVVAGAGEGQFRDVLAVDGKQVTVGPRWNVVPDATSRVALGSFHERAVAYRNNLDGKAAQGAIKAHTSAAAIEPYGGVLDLVCDANSVTDCRHGVYVMGHALDLPSAPISMQPSLFHLYVNNAIRRSREAAIVTASSNVASELGGFGFMFRGNLVENALQDAVTFVYGDQGHNLDMVTFDRTVESDTPVGFSLNYNGAPHVSTGSLLLVDNQFARGGAAARDISVAAGHDGATDVWLQGDVLGGVAPTSSASSTILHAPAPEISARQTSSAGTSAHAPPEIPVRELAASARARGGPIALYFMVYNVSTVPMTYPLQIDPAKRWLSAAPPLEVAGGSAARYELRCDPAGLRPGEYSATVYVGADRLRAISVNLTVLP